MHNFNYNSRQFVGVENYDDGDLTGDTVFHYYQKDRVVWGTYEGGGVQFGTLIASMQNDGSLDMIWQYLSMSGEFVSGTCLSIPEVLPDGRYRLRESWKIDSGESGTSVIEETRP
ncbi:MAG: n-acetylglutamate synthase [Candidatus Zixiibacteriota bacterium]|nr:MAG: n-acetylglutamate synthase [candidate division Zixibacteria bacterium]